MDGARAAEHTPTTAADIAAAVEGRRSGDGWLVRCPAHDDRTPSLSIAERDGRMLLHCHAGCSQAAVITALHERGLWPAAGTARAALRTRRDDVPAPELNRRTAAALRIWGQSQPAAGTLVEQYLRSRGIEIAAIPEMVRYHPALRYDDDRTLPAMVAAVQHVSGAVVAIHRTYLRADGTSKAEIDPAKKMLGPTKGGAVRLTEASETLVIAEGIETALSVHVATGLPTWAALSAPGIASLILPPRPAAADVLIFADHDSAGIAAAEKAASRWHGEGRFVRIALPPKPGADFNDLLRGAA